MNSYTDYEYNRIKNNHLNHQNLEKKPIDINFFINLSRLLILKSDLVKLFIRIPSWLFKFLRLRQNGSSINNISIIYYNKIREWDCLLWKFIGSASTNVLTIIAQYLDFSNIKTLYPLVKFNDYQLALITNKNLIKSLVQELKSFDERSLMNIYKKKKYFSKLFIILEWLCLKSITKIHSKVIYLFLKHSLLNSKSKYVLSHSDIFNIYNGELYQKYIKIFKKIIILNQLDAIKIISICGPEFDIKLKTIIYYSKWKLIIPCLNKIMIWTMFSGISKEYDNYSQILVYSIRKIKNAPLNFKIELAKFILKKYKNISYGYIKYKNFLLPVNIQGNFVFIKNFIKDVLPLSLLINDN